MDATPKPFSVSYLERKPALALALSLVLTLLIAYGDWKTDFEMSLLVLYWIPITLVTWVFGPAAGYSLSAFCVIVSVATDTLQGKAYSHPFFLLWNFLTQLVAFSLFVLVLGRARQGYRGEHARRLATEEATRLKTDLMAFLNHEMRNATTLIKLSLLSLAEETPDIPPAHQPYYHAIDRVATTLEEASENFLNNTAIETGRLSLHPAAIDMHELLRETGMRFRGLLKERRLRWQPEIEATLPAVRADRAALRLVLINLIGNAIKYTPPEGSVSVRVRQGAPGRIFVDVRDTGIGMTAEEVARIRTGFYRTEAGRQMADGYGLGLKIVSKLLDAHGSRLTIASTVGQGSRFSFELPAVPGAAERRGSEKAGVRDGGVPELR